MNPLSLLPHSAIHDPDDLECDHQLLSFDAFFKKDEFRQLYQVAKPFPHVVIPDFFELGLAEQLVKEFPFVDSKQWQYRYNNPIENKLAMNDLHRMPPLAASTMMHLNHWSFVRWIKHVTGIENLEADPYLHGAGLHCMPAPGGKLDMHLDYSLHPVTGKERRVNLIVYLNDADYKEEGHLELWNQDMSECVQKIAPTFNTAVLFSTTDLSWHGMPEPLQGNVPRQSMAVYYVSDPRPEIVHRPKAKFVGRPSDPKSERLDRLRLIRAERRLTPEDVLL